MPRILDLDYSFRPQEKLLLSGANNLTDKELIALILRSGTKGKNVLEVAEDVLKILKNNYTDVEVEDVQKISGIGQVRACQIIASIELSKRYLGEVKGKIIKTPHDIFLFLSYLKYKKQENCISLTLDNGSRIIQKRVVSIGLLNMSLIHPREVFAPALQDRADSIVLIHNHPSGSCKPSKADMEVTLGIKEAGKILGIKLKDHVIIAKDSYFSFAEEGVLM